MATPPFQLLRPTVTEWCLTLLSHPVFKTYSESDHVLPPSLLPPLVQTSLSHHCVLGLFQQPPKWPPCFYSNSLLSKKANDHPKSKSDSHKPLLETFKGLLLPQEETKSLCWLKSPDSATSSVTLSPPHSAPAHSTPSHEGLTALLIGFTTYLRAFGLLSFLETFLQNQWLQSSRLHLCYISTQVLSTRKKLSWPPYLKCTALLSFQSFLSPPTVLNSIGHISFIVCLPPKDSKHWHMRAGVFVSCSLPLPGSQYTFVEWRNYIEQKKLE